MRDPWAEDVEVVSSENVAFGVESAGLGSRFAASCIDLTLQMLIIGAGSAFVAWSLDSVRVDDWSPALRNITQAALGIVVFCILWGYYFAFEWRWDGQTPGKRALGLRVLHTDGSPLTLWGSLVRNLLRVADFLPLFYGVGAIIALLGPNNRRAGDMAANTIVARERHDASRQVLGIGQAADAFLSSAHNPQGIAPVRPANESQPEEPEEALDLTTLALRSRLKAEDWELALDFARRHEALAPAVRARLAQRLAQQIASKAGLGTSLEAGADAEAFVLRVAREASQQSARA